MPNPNPPKNQPDKPDPKSKPAATAKADAPRLIRVRATKLGIYKNARVKVGTVFNFLYTSGTKMPSWVEVVDEDNNPIGQEAAAAPTAAEEPASSAPSKDDVI